MKEILKQLRKQKGFSQSQVAETIGVSRQSYIKYESGEVEPSLEVVRKLAEFYGVDSSDLINYEIQKSDKNQPIYSIDPKIASLYVNEPVTAYGKRAVYFDEKEIADFAEEAEKMGISIRQFFVEAGKAFASNFKSKDTLSEWKPLSLGKMLSDYADGENYEDLLNDSYRY